MRKIKKYDLLFILGFIFSPVTGLRLTQKVGPSELMLLIWSFIAIFKIKINKKNSYFIKYWVIFIFIIFLSALYASNKFNNSIDFFGLITWIYLLFVSVISFYYFQETSESYIILIIKKIVVFGSLLYFLLFALSKFGIYSIFNINLWYAEQRFTAGARNPHQLSSLVSSFIFYSVYLKEKSTEISKKLFYLILILINLLVLFQTDSSTGYMAVFLSVIYLLLSRFAIKFQIKKISIFIFFIILIILFHKYLLDIATRFIMSDVNGWDRILIFRTINIPMSMSPIIGLGPGVHARSGTIEFHNTYLEILAMSGLVGFVNFTYFSSIIFNKLKKQPYLKAILYSMYFYAIAGFAMRRIFWWLTISLILGLIEE